MKNFKTVMIAAIATLFTTASFAQMDKMSSEKINFE